MLIEIHMIQNHGPANLNRDDLGAPKTCMFGGSIRARISSQCLKRSIRRSPEFRVALERNGGIRTRRLIELIAQQTARARKEDEAKIRKVFEDGGIGVKDGQNTSDILFFLPESAIQRMGEALRNTTEDNDLGEKFAKILGESSNTPDIALFGRMTEFDAKGPLESLKGKLNVEAALSAAHAISTHTVVNEVDYFTAADDIPGPDAGAAHVNETLFASACFYKYFAIDVDQLKRNLHGDEDLANKTVRCFLEAAVKANPSGKQHAFAAFSLPEGVLIEVKKKQPAVPVNYANAFADPVPEKTTRGLIGESIARLGQYVHDIAAGYAIEAERFWFSPNLRYHLKWMDESKREPEREQSVVDNGNEFGEFNSFLARVMQQL